MAPRRTRRATRKNHRRPESAQQIPNREVGSPDMTPDNSSTATVVALSSDENHVKSLGNSSGEADNIITNSYTGCSTPKGKRYRIPEIQTCPPAPKKRRVVSNFALKRSSPVAFFAPPDVELFFFLALRGISVSI